MPTTSHKLKADSNINETMAERTPPTVEPSMEEILASIRKIISDEDKPENADMETSPDVTSVDAELPGGEVTQDKSEAEDTSFGDLEALVSAGLTRVSERALPASEDEPDAQEEEAPPEEMIEESVEELRALKRSMASASIEQQLEEQALKSDIIFRDEGIEEPDAANPPVEPSPEPTEPVSDVFDLTQMINEDGSITDVIKGMDIHAPAAGAPASAQSAEDQEPEMVRLTETPPADPYDVDIDVDPDPSDDESLIAGDALEMVMVRTLRPMLKRWMDENLPPIVERMVREEMRRRPKD